MEREQREYTIWCGQNLSEELQRQLLEIKENEEEIYDRFCRGLTFGTSGMRGRMGAVTCRMNPVVVRRATLGIADYVSSRYAHPAIAISYDTRMHSKEYAKPWRKEESILGSWASRSRFLCCLSQCGPWALPGES